MTTTELTVDRQTRRLTAEEVKQYHERGFVKNLPLFDEAGVQALQTEFMKNVDKVPEEVDLYRVNNWHKANRWFYDLAHTPAILDYVEDLLGANFHLWAAAFFIKFPHDESTVPWHQDARYWAIDPRKTVTVWLAAFDTDKENGCMRVVPGSHRWGDLPHEDIPGSPAWDKNTKPEERRKQKYVLWQRIDPNSFSEDDAVDMDLKAGEISLHDDDLIHGSTGNPSDRMRAGITMRYCPTEVKGDLSVWPNFEVYPVRGVDEYNHNPVGRVPTKYGHPTTYNQKSSEFES